MVQANSRTTPLPCHSAGSHVTGVCAGGGVRRIGQMETLHPAQEAALSSFLCLTFLRSQIKRERAPFIPPTPAITQKLKALLWLIFRPSFPKWNKKVLVCKKGWILSESELCRCTEQHPPSLGPCTWSPYFCPHTFHHLRYGVTR